jgi:hypothetical protein
MFIVLSIAVGILVAWLSYRILFYDVGDFLEGCGKFTRGLMVFLFARGYRHRRIPPPSAEDLEDEGWSSGIRFFLFLALSCGCGYFTYYEFHKLF